MSIGLTKQNADRAYDNFVVRDRTAARVVSGNQLVYETVEASTVSVVNGVVAGGNIACQSLDVNLPIAGSAIVAASGVSGDDAGGQIELIHTDGTTGHKFLRVNDAGAFQIMNDDESKALITLSDAGLMTVGALGISMPASSTLRVASGSATSRCGVATLTSAGTTTVANTTVTANTLVFVTRQTVVGTAGQISTAISAGVNFTITTTGAETSQVSWFLIEKA